MNSAGVIGWPIAHSKSPLIHRFWLGKLGMDGDYGRFPVAPDQLAGAVGAIRALGLSGINVTVPHKVAIMPFLDTVTPEAGQVGAVNLVVNRGGRLSGYNTDVDGVLEALPSSQLPAGGSVCLIGSGGAARAALAAFHRRQVGSVRLLARNSAKALALLQEFDLAGDVRPLSDATMALQGADAIVNATSLGMHGGDPMPPDLLAALQRVPGAGIAFDMVYAPLETAFLAAARQQQRPVIDGLAMLIGQAAAAFQHLFGALPPRQHDGELRALLIA